MKAQVLTVVNPQKRAGLGAKGAWNIMEVEVEREDGSIVKADSFDTLVAGDPVELEPNSYTSPTTGKTFNGWNAKAPRAKYNKPASADTTEVLQAIRMVFRELKEVRADVKRLMGDEPLGAPEVELAAAQAQRDWAKVGQGAKQETEPLPEQPADMTEFMNQ